MAKGLNISGNYLEACNCNAACPCVFLSPPTEGECNVLVAWHIDRGTLDGVKLDGLNAVLFAHTPGHMMETKWRVALYLDKRADAAQQEALGKIFSGQAGGPPAALHPLIGEVMGMRTAAIEIKADGKKRSLTVDDIADVEIEALAGQDGGDVEIANHPFTPVPGQPAVVARSSRMRYADHGFKRDLSGRNGFYSPFTYQA